MKSKDNLYPIRAVSQLTGLTADSIRAWERRYQAVTPVRGQDGRGGRLYSPEDVHRLNLLKSAIENGHSIGQIANWENAQLETLPVLNKPKRKKREVVEEHEEVNKIFSYLEEYDALGADKYLGRLASIFSPREFIHRIVVPAITRVGTYWRRGHFSIAQEHMASSLLRNLLGTLLRVHIKDNPRKKILFTTPSGEYHEFGILTAAMLAVAGGLGVIYLGPNLPVEEVVRAAEKVKPDAVVIGLLAATDTTRANASPYLRELSDTMPKNTDLILGGLLPGEIVRAAKDAGCIHLASFQQFEDHLTLMGASF